MHVASKVTSIHDSRFTISDSRFFADPSAGWPLAVHCLPFTVYYSRVTAPANPLSRWTSASAIVLYLAGGKLLFHLVTAGRYGIFRDELYYLACSEHLAWGYVDQPPLIALVAWFARHVFGSSLLGLRLLPAIAGAALVWLTGRLARELGGARFAQALAALAAFAVPIFLVFHHWLTMNAFEPLIWLAAALGCGGLTPLFISAARSASTRSAEGAK
jgi:hypothetical protein